MLILGIDPGLKTVGVGLVQADSVSDCWAIDWLTIETSPGLSLADRLREIEEDLDCYIDEVKPELAVVEKLFFSTNRKTALDVAQARGAILAIASRHGLPIIEVTPPELKAAITGDGRADKEQMKRMVKTLLKMTEMPQPDDAADALALALYGAVAAKTMSMTEMMQVKIPSKPVKK